MARPICLRLLVHWARRAASRADCTAGSKSAISTAMIAITTSSSIRVKPAWRIARSLCRFTESAPSRGGISCRGGTEPECGHIGEGLHFPSVGQFERRQGVRSRRDLGAEQGLADVEVAPLEAVGAGTDPAPLHQPGVASRLDRCDTVAFLFAPLDQHGIGAGTGAPADAVDH